MRILIAGGFGFVGGRLATHLARAGHQIVLGSRRARSPPGWLPEAEVAQFQWEDVTALQSICHRVEVVIQAAGMNAQDCHADPVNALAQNGLATARLVGAASGCSVQRFIYLSTAHVYASPLVGMITEATCPRNLHPYATSHLAGEHAVLRATQQRQIRGMVLRLSNAFGTPTHRDVNCWMLMVNDLCRQAVLERKLVLQTSGLQQRDFIGLTEVCKLTGRLVVGHEEYLQNSIYNVGAGVSQTVLEMAQMIQARCMHVLGYKPELLRAEIGAKEQHPALSYQSEYLAAMGESCNGLDCTMEIDNLLRYCEAAFN